MKRDTLVWTVLLVVAGLWLAWRASTGRMGLEYVQPLAVGEADGTLNDAAIGAAEFSWPRTLGLWVAAFLTLAIFSFLYRDNPFYKLAEAIIVGVSAAYWMVVAFWTVLSGKFTFTVTQAAAATIVIALTEDIRKASFARVICVALFLLQLLLLCFSLALLGRRELRQVFAPLLEEAEHGGVVDQHRVARAL